jgi:hypothetical protein
MRDCNGAYRSPDTFKIWELSKKGLSSTQISRELGFKFGKVNSALRRGREGNILPPHPIKPISSGSHHKNYMRLGNVSAILDALNKDQVDWLATEARKIGCETVAEFILELVRDAHANEELKNE